MTWKVHNRHLGSKEGTYSSLNFMQIYPFLHSQTHWDSPPTSLLLYVHDLFQNLFKSLPNKVAFVQYHTHLPRKSLYTQFHYSQIQRSRGCPYFFFKWGSLLLNDSYIHIYYTFVKVLPHKIKSLEVCSIYVALTLPWSYIVFFYICMYIYMHMLYLYVLLQSSNSQKSFSNGSW